MFLCVLYFPWPLRWEVQSTEFPCTRIGRQSKVWRSHWNLAALNGVVGGMWYVVVCGAFRHTESLQRRQEGRVEWGGGGGWGAGISWCSQLGDSGREGGRSYHLHHHLLPPPPPPHLLPPPYEASQVPPTPIDLVTLRSYAITNIGLSDSQEPPTSADNFLPKSWKLKSPKRLKAKI